MSDLTKFFPGLLSTSFIVTSPETKDYNCIAWAAGDTLSWWWPDQNFQYYWPPSIPRDETLNTFIAAYQTLGFTRCEDGYYESDFVKIAIFIDNNGIPTHAARQLPNGRWTSKCGKSEDIEHELESLCGQLYGNIACFMKKRITEMDSI